MLELCRHCLLPQGRSTAAKGAQGQGQGAAWAWARLQSGPARLREMTRLRQRPPRPWNRPSRSCGPFSRTFFLPEDGALKCPPRLWQNRGQAWRACGPACRCGSARLTCWAEHATGNRGRAGSSPWPRSPWRWRALRFAGRRWRGEGKTLRTRELSPRHDPEAQHGTRGGSQRRRTDGRTTCTCRGSIARTRHQGATRKPSRQASGEPGARQARQ